MTETKHVYTSRTIIGAVMAMVASGIGLIRLLMPEAVDPELSEKVQDPAVVDAIVVVVGLLGGLLAFFGRLWAKKEVILPILLTSILLFGAVGCITSNPYTVEQQLLLEQRLMLVEEYEVRCAAGDIASCQEGLRDAAEILRKLLE